MKPDQPPQEPSSKKFHELLAALDDGGVVNQIDEDLPRLIQQTLAVAQSKGTTGTAAGTLKLKITFKASANGEVEISADKETKAPTLPCAVTRRWINPKTMEIIDRNPKQLGLDFKEAPQATTELRSV